MKPRGILLSCFLLAGCQANMLVLKPESSIMTNKIEPAWYDFLMDMVLEELRHYLEIKKETVIPIPPVSTGFEYEFIGIMFSGWFNTTEGKFTNPASIQRQGDVTVNHSTGKIVTSMTVTFSQLEVWFPEYIAAVIGISESGFINTTVQNNAVFIEVTVMFLPHCIVGISKLEVTKMSGIIVNMNGLGVLSSLESQIIAWVLQSYKTAFTNVVQNVVRTKLEQELSYTKICKFKRLH